MAQYRRAVMLPPPSSSNINTNHVSLFIFASLPKYFIASYHPILRCLFYHIKIMLSTFATERECFVPAFVLYMWAIISECNKQELAFSHATAQMTRFWTVQKCFHRCIPVWCSCLTQPSILSPHHHPQIYFICHTISFRIQWILGVTVQWWALFPYTTTNTRCRLLYLVPSD